MTPSYQEFLLRINLFDNDGPPFYGTCLGVWSQACFYKFPKLTAEEKALRCNGAIFYKKVLYSGAVDVYNIHPFVAFFTLEDATEFKLIIEDDDL